MVCNGKAKFDKEFGLNVIPIVIISNETTHDRDVAFTNNQKLISIVQDISPDITNFHFWSDGCAGQFRSRLCISIVLLLPTSSLSNMGLW